MFNSVRVDHLASPADLALLFTENPRALVVFGAIFAVFFAAGRVARCRDRRLMRRVRRGSMLESRDVGSVLGKLSTTGVVLLYANVLMWIVGITGLFWGADAGPSTSCGSIFTHWGSEWGHKPSQTLSSSDQTSAPLY